MEDDRSLPPPNKEETPPARGREEDVDDEGTAMEPDEVDPGTGRWVDDPLGSLVGGETWPGVDRPPGEEGVPPVDDCWLPMMIDVGRCSSLVDRCVWENLSVILDFLFRVFV